MKRPILLVLLLAAVLVPLFVIGGEAATTDSFTITVQCNRVTSVDVSTATTGGGTPSIAFGTVATNATLIADTTIYVLNDSAAGTASIQTYQLYASGSPATWDLNTVSWAGGADQIAVAAVFKAAYPAASDFNSGAGTDDLILETSPGASWGATAWNPATGAYATPGRHARGDSPLALRIAIKTPTATSVATSQSMTITVTAF